MREYLKYFNMGLMMVMPALVCLFFGSFLDSSFGTGRILTLILLLIGILSGIWSAIRSLQSLD